MRVRLTFVKGTTPSTAYDAEMRILILGLGNIGMALAERLQSNGHTVIGTTTTAGKVGDLKKRVDEVRVLFGHERDKVAAAAVGADVIVVTVAPDVRRSRTVDERRQHYREVLVDSCDSAVAACPRVIFASSFSVYGDAGDGRDPVDEETPYTNSDEPSCRFYQQAEQAVLAQDAGCVLRFPDMYGAPGDLGYPQRARLCHEYMNGNAVFSAHAPLYCIHYLDVVAAIEHAISANLCGAYNVCDDDHMPYTNQQVFDAICDAEGLERLTFLNQISAPERKISAAKIYATGYRVGFPDPNAVVVEAAAKTP